MNELFPKRLQLCRERRRFSRSALVELCGLSRNMIGMYERGEKKPSLGVVIQIADLFAVSLDWLCGREN